MIGTNDCGKGCIQCDGDCQDFGVPIPREKNDIQKNFVSDIEKIEDSEELFKRRKAQVEYLEKEAKTFRSDCYIWARWK